MLLPSGSTTEPHVVVVGGANVDVKARTTGRVVPATSNPGATRSSPGGVARNIADNLARLGTSTHLVAVVGADRLGDELLEATAAAGVHVGHVHRGTRPTGTYTAVLDHLGDLVVAVADMAVTAELTTAVVDAAADLLRAAALVVVDANLHPDTFVHTLALAGDAGVPVVIEPVSAPKARAVVLGRHPVHTVTPNLDELAALTGLATVTDEQVEEAVGALLLRDVEVVWVRRGGSGSLLGRAGQRATRHLTVPELAPHEVLDVTGAGDAATAAYCHALIGGADPLDAAVLGHRAGTLTVASTLTVRPDLAAHLS